MVQETRQPEPDTRAGLVDWAQSLVARAKRARSVLSPWVQRTLETGASGRPRLLSLFEGDGRALVERVTRQGDGSRVWRPDLGRVSPAALDRFGGEIVRRHQPLADKYRVEAPEWDEAQSTGLVLARPAIGPAVMPDARQPGPPSGLPSMLAGPPSAPPALQRQAVPPPSVSQERAAVARQPGARIFSRVEEITPAAGGTIEAESPQRSSTGRAVLAEQAAEEGLAPPAQTPAVPWQRTLESPPATGDEAPPLRRAAREQEAPAQRPASLPGEAPSPEVEGTPVAEMYPGEPSQPVAISGERQEPPPPVSPPQAEAGGKALQLERQAEERRPSPVPPIQAGAEAEAVLQRRPDHPLRPERQAEEDGPSPVLPPEVGAAEIESISTGVQPPVQRMEDGELPAAPSPPQGKAAGAEPAPSPEVPALDRDGGEERLAGPPPPVMRATGAEPALRAEGPPPDLGGAEDRPTGPPPVMRAAGEEQVFVPEVTPLQRAPLEDQVLPGGERIEAGRSELAYKPEGESAAPVPEQVLPPEQRSEGQDVPAMPPAEGEQPVRKVPAQRPPPTGPRQPAQRLGEGQEALGVPDEQPVPGPAPPIFRGGLQPRAVEHRPVQRTAILPQARLGVPFEREPAMPVGPQGPARERFWTGAAARRTLGTGPLPLRAPVQAVMEGAPAVPEAPVQRLPLAVVPRPETEPTGADLVQRQNGTGPAVSEEPAGEVGEPDLDELARQVYPLVKRMLAVERERRLSR